MLTVRGSWIVVLLVGCRAVSDPVVPALRFALTTIDNQVLPRAPFGAAPDQAIEAAELDFGAIAGLSDGAVGTVALTFRVAGQTTTNSLPFAVTGSILHITVCPSRPNCLIGMTELSGPIAPDVLVLGSRLGGVAAPYSVFRFEALGSD